MQLSPRLMFPSIALTMVFSLFAADVLAQGPGRGGRQRGARGGGNNATRLLASEAVQAELEMTDEQIELLKEMAQGRGRPEGFDREAFRAEMEGLSDEERSAKMKEMRENRTNEQKAKLEEILLPHQMERLEQLSFQASAQGGARSLMNGPLAEKLNITEEQKEALESKAAELEKQFSEQVAKLRAEMQEKLLSTLSADQQAEFKKLAGDSFTFESQRRGGQFGGGQFGGGMRGGAGMRGGRGGGARGGRGGAGRGEGGGRRGRRGGDGDEGLGA